MTKVVNVRMKYIRGDFCDLACWMDRPGNVYIGRRHSCCINGGWFPREDSPWANPYRVGQHGTREQVIEKYRTYITAELAKPGAKARGLDLELLRGRTLGCWCKPDPCHGDVLVQLLGEAS